MFKNLTRIVLLALICAPAFTSCSTMPKQASTPPPNKSFLQAKVFKRKYGEPVQYLLFLPEGYRARKNEKFPLIFFLHGAGERGTNIWRASIHGPSNYIEKHPDFPFIMVSPQCQAGAHWDNESLLSLLDDVTMKYRVDTTRIYLTGLSMGGYGSWDLGTTYPDRFAAMVPICGGGEMISVLLAGGDGKLPALKSLPIWAFHGGKDNVVPPAESERMINMLKTAGCKDVQLTIYPEATHNSWAQTYDNPKLYEWFLEHQRKAAK